MFNISSVLCKIFGNERVCLNFALKYSRNIKKKNKKKKKLKKADDVSMFSDVIVTSSFFKVFFF